MQLIEAAFAIAVQALLSAALVQQIAVIAIVAHQAERAASSRQSAAHVERLVDIARNAASASADIVAPVFAISQEGLTFHADLDGNGRIDTRSSESIGLYLNRGRNSTRLIHKIGRQPMALAEGSDGAFSLTAYDRSGAPTRDPARASLLALAWGNNAGANTHAWFALPRPLP